MATIRKKTFAKRLGKYIAEAVNRVISESEVGASNVNPIEGLSQKVDAEISELQTKLEQTESYRKEQLRLFSNLCDDINSTFDVVDTNIADYDDEYNVSFFIGGTENVASSDEEYEKFDRAVDSLVYPKYKEYGIRVIASEPYGGESNLMQICVEVGLAQ